MARTSWRPLRPIFSSCIKNCSFESPPARVLSALTRDSFVFSARFASSKNKPVRRVKIQELDIALAHEKKLKLALKLKEVLANEKAHVMCLDDLGKLKRKLGFSRSKKFAAFAANYPRVFNIIKDKDSVLWMEFTDEVEDLLEEEEEFRKHVHEPWLVGTLRKMLMLSASRRLPIAKVSKLTNELGLPGNFKTDFVHNYPQFFRVLDKGGKYGQVLELTEWDPSLAVTARDRKMKEESCEVGEVIGANAGYGSWVSYPKGYTPSRKQRELMSQFQALPFFSPYKDTRKLLPKSLELEKRTVALVHEFLSLTLQKRAVLNHILHFRKEFKLPPQMLQLLLRYQGIFYISLKGDTHTVFLKEAYEGSTVKERNPLLDFNSRLDQLFVKGKAGTVACEEELTNEGRLNGDREMDDNILSDREAWVEEAESDGEELSDEDDIAHKGDFVDSHYDTDSDAYDELSMDDTIGKS